MQKNEESHSSLDLKYPSKEIGEGWKQVGLGLGPWIQIGTGPSKVSKHIAVKNDLKIILHAKKKMKHYRL